MPALALVFIVAGAFAIRQVIVGRAKESPADLKDASLALLSGNTGDFQTVLARRGSNTDSAGIGSTSGASVGDSSASGSIPALSPSGNTAIASEAVNLGQKASGYELGASGPNFYDCSGLIWRAMRNIGLYNGPRFTTATFEQVAHRIPMTMVDSPEAGDVAIWVSGGHMGVMVSSTDFYSARSPAKGIGVAPISADIKFFGQKPDYWRLNIPGNATIADQGN